MVLGLAGCTAEEPMVNDDGGSSSTGPNETTVASTGPDSGVDETSTGADEAVTYHGSVRAIVERHCVSCHQPGNIGPFSMTSYEEVHDLREAIVLSVEEGTMPPWMPGPDCQTYVGDPSMEPDEIEQLRQWLDDGAVEGDPGSYVPPEIPPAPGLTRVDLTLELPEPYVPTAQPDDYRCFLLDWPQTETTYVSGFAALPDQLSMVHHVIAFAIPPDQVAQYEALDAAEPGVGYTCFGGPGGPITDPQSAGIWLGSWAPGGFAGDFPEGTGIPVEPGSRVVLQVHYNTLAGERLADRSAVQLKLETEVEHPAMMLLWADPEWLMGSMPIPAGETVVHEFEMDPTPFMNLLTDVIPPFSPFRIYSSAHHMHTLGTRAQQQIHRSGGADTCLLELPRWDFDWQQSYRFAEPVVFEPGDRLRIACEWNNEAGEQTVNWGDGTQDEMCLGIFYATGM